MLSEHAECKHVLLVYEAALLQILDVTKPEAAESNLLWRLATRLGASCSIHLAISTTHVVALSATTDKAKQALKQGSKLVEPEWLFACEAR
jgi:hypothetical protein